MIHFNKKEIADSVAVTIASEGSFKKVGKLGDCQPSGIDNNDIDSISDCSFDETSMDSCPLAAITETRGNDLSKDGNEVEVTSLEEAKSVIAALRARQRAQAHQMLAWRRTLKLQVRNGNKIWMEWDRITARSVPRIKVVQKLARLFQKIDFSNNSIANIQLFVSLRFFLSTNIIQSTRIYTSDTNFPIPIDRFIHLEDKNYTCFA